MLFFYKYFSISYFICLAVLLLFFSTSLALALGLFFLLVRYFVFFFSQFYSVLFASIFSSFSVLCAVLHHSYRSVQFHHFHIRVCVCAVCVYVYRWFTLRKWLCQPILLFLWTYISFLQLFVLSPSLLIWTYFCVYFSFTRQFNTSIWKF